jgi:hypothetical protein
MSVETDLHAMKDSGDPFLIDLAVKAEQIKDMFDQGQLTNSEYTDLLADLVHSKNINDAVQDLALKEKINGVLNALVALAGAVG